MAKHQGIYRRGNIWWIRYYDTYKRRLFESSKSSNLQDAQQLLLKRQQQSASNSLPENPNSDGRIRFGEYMKIYSDWCRRQKSYKHKFYNINLLVRRYGNLRLNEITPYLIEQHISERLSQGIAPATCNRIVAVNKHGFTLAENWGYIDEGILRKVRKVKPLKENNRRMRFLSQDEQMKLLKECRGTLKSVVIIALQTGMRRGEILGLRWSQIDLENGYINLYDNDVKSGKGRSIPISNTLRNVFDKMTSERELGQEYLFVCKRTGKNIFSMRTAFEAALRRANLQGDRVLFHTLRHTFASTLAMAGVDMGTLREILGHSSLQMTMRYSHLSTQHIRKAIMLLDNLNPSETISDTM